MGNLEGRDLATVALSIGRGLGKRILTQLKSQAPQTEVEEAGPLLQSERKKKIMRRWPLSSLSLSFHSSVGVSHWMNATGNQRASDSRKWSFLWRNMRENMQRTGSEEWWRPWEEGQRRVLEDMTAALCSHCCLQCPVCISQLLRTQMAKTALK